MKVSENLPRAIWSKDTSNWPFFYFRGKMILAPSKSRRCHQREPGEGIKFERV